MKRFLLGLSLSIIILFFGVAGAGAFDVVGDIALLVDAETGQVLFEKNAHKRVEPASITKIMAMILCQEAIEKGEVSTEDLVTISRYAQSMYGSQIYLAAGEKVSVQGLLKGIAISSANDATVALAEYLAGTEDAFVRQMNKRAKELGMENTQFINSTGLPPEAGDHYSTAYDISLMSREFLRHPQLLEYSKVWLEYLDLPGRQAMMVNFNRLVNDYPGVDGIKTGHTSSAGYCISVTAQRDERRFIVVIMNSESEETRNEEASRLLDFAFRAFQRDIIIKQHDFIKQQKIFSARKQEVDLVAASTLAPYIRRGETESIRIEREYWDLDAPLEKGQKAGILKVYQGDMILGEVDIVVGEDVARANALVVLWRRFILFLTNLFKK